MSDNHSKNQSNNSFDEVFAYIKDDFDDLMKTTAASSQMPELLHGAQQLKAVCYKMRSEYVLFRHYYKNHVLPAAEAMVSKLRDDYTTAEHKYPDYVDTDSYFNNVIKDAIHAGYVTINHKIESFVEFIQHHSRGKAYGPLPDNQFDLILYEDHLRERFDIVFEDFLGKGQTHPVLCEECKKPKQQNKEALVPRPVLYARIKRIRLIANRVKHQSGYPAGEKDQILQSVFGQEAGKPIHIDIDEFLYDLAYVDAFLFVLSNLIINCYSYATTHKVLYGLLTDDQEIHRTGIAKLNEKYEEQMEWWVNEYKSKKIDRIHLKV